MVARITIADIDPLAAQYSIKPEYIKYANHSKIGRLNMKDEMDIIDHLNAMTKPERVIFTLMKCNLNWADNHVKLDRAKLTPTEQTYLARAYGLLKKRGLVKRIKRNHYMFSPYHFMPSSNPEKLKPVMLEWSKL